MLMLMDNQAFARAHSAGALKLAAEHFSWETALDRTICRTKSMSKESPLSGDLRSSGQGDICHYTFQLAEALAQAGCDIAVMAPEGYELWRTAGFKLTFFVQKSLIKSWLDKTMPGLLNGSSNQPGKIAHQTINRGQRTQGSSIADLLRTLRLELCSVEPFICSGVALTSFMFNGY